jgi:hypothetical protein
VQRHAAVEPAPGRVQPVVWTSAELAERLRRGDPIAREARASGCWLRGDPDELLRAAPADGAQTMPNTK